jgi:membrane protease YdiL (CAAX protease family)
MGKVPTLLRKSIAPAGFMAGMIFFAWFVHADGYLNLLSIAVLCACSLQAGWYFARSGRDSWKLYSMAKPGSHWLAFAISFVLGLAVGTMYRSNAGFGYLPASLGLFAFTAVAIGATEELVFRGYLLQRLQEFTSRPLVVVLLSALAHALYKTAIFASGYALHQVNLPDMFLYTAIAGIPLAAVTVYTRSVWPAALAHALFDLVVYGDAPSAPWWVW